MEKSESFIAPVIAGSPVNYDIRLEGRGLDAFAHIRFRDRLIVFAGSIHAYSNRYKSKKYAITEDYQITININS